MVLVALATVLSARAATETPQQAFVKRWEGQPVVVKQTLYTLVYNERGRLGNTRSGKRDGLTVVTPSAGTYLQFDGRQGRDDVVERQPQKVVEAVSVAYQPDSLDIRPYRKVEPVLPVDAVRTESGGNHEDLLRCGQSASWFGCG